MTAEKQGSDENKDDTVVARELAEALNTQFNSGDNYLTSIKVCINPRYQKANIYVGYGDMTRLKESGSEDTMAGLCEAFIEWPDADSSENNNASWRNLSYPKTQVKRALLLSEELRTQLIILSYSDDLKCYIENRKVHIDRA